jgi:hypothetical protein
MENFGINHTSLSSSNTHYNDPVTLQSRVLLRKISLFGSEENPYFLKDLDDSLPFSQKPNLNLHP